MNPQRQATVLMPGTCGELVQGTLEGEHFLVSCPVDLYAEVSVELMKSPGDFKTPPRAHKAKAALKRSLEYFNAEEIGARLTIRSPLSWGKGMGASTADVAGTIYAFAKALGREIEPEKVAHLAVSIEPTDGTVFPNLVLFDHRRGFLYQELGLPPPLDILALDFGGVVDTLEYNAVDRSVLLKKLEPRAREALEMVRTGLAQGNLGLIGQGATLSAICHQEVLYKPQLEKVLSLSREIGAVGINVAHSGVVIGVLLDPKRNDPQAASRFLEQKLPGLKKLYPLHLVSGGYRSRLPGALS